MFNLFIIVFLFFFNIYLEIRDIEVGWIRGEEMRVLSMYFEFCKEWKILVVNIVNFICVYLV